MNRMLTFVALAVVALFFGCATNSQPTASGGQTGRCEVCRYNNDLACVEFRMKQTTPTAEYGGETYCFCSKTCQAAFEKNPAKYAHHGSSGATTR
ncbi:MAG TPA: YHS domain-containing protein [Verrucomicrobiae bacterium]|nr:YHS domain-containing protein [Verrucomicrobiae bacterium]